MLHKKNLPHYLALMRVDKPIGTYLLLWPTLWALWIASNGLPKLWLLFVFTFGVFIMRSAGCIMNDIADRNFDGFVARTKMRPLAAKLISLKEAVVLLLLLLFIALLLALCLQGGTLLLSIPALVIALSYPFMKRIHSLPQAHLGLAFSFGIPMVFMEIQGQLPWASFLLMAVNILWVLCFDTEYAMSDREDDKSINVRSSALLFEKWLGAKDYYIIIGFQMGALLLLVVLGILQHYAYIWWVTLSIVAILFIYHIHLIKTHDRTRCFMAFMHNNWVGLVIFMGLVLTYAMPQMGF